MLQFMGSQSQTRLSNFGHLIQRVDSLERSMMLGGIGGRKKRGRQRMRWLDGITDSIKDRNGMDLTEAEDIKKR